MACRGEPPKRLPTSPRERAAGDRVARDARPQAKAAFDRGDRLEVALLAKIGEHRADGGDRPGAAAW